MKIDKTQIIQELAEQAQVDDIQDDVNALSGVNSSISTINADIVNLKNGHVEIEYFFTVAPTTAVNPTITPLYTNTWVLQVYSDLIRICLWNGSSWVVNAGRDVYRVDKTEEPREYVIGQLIDRIMGIKMAASSVTDIFSGAFNPSGPWTFNASNWTGADFSGISWNTAQKATMITPRHFLSTHHYYPTNGTSLNFQEVGGSIVTRTVSNSVQVGSTDIRVGLLSADVTAPVKKYPLLAPVNYINFIGFRAVTTFDERKAGSKYITQMNGSIVLNDVYGALSVTSPFNIAVVTGDSSHPVFLLNNNDLVLLSAWTSGAGNFGSGDNYSMRSPDIEKAIDTLGRFGHSISYYSL